MRTLKALTVTFFLCLSFSAISAELICGATKSRSGKKKLRTYPINDAAIAFISGLGLKCCSGTSSEKVKPAVIAAKHTVTFVEVSFEELQAAKSKLAKRGGAAGPSL